MTDTNPIEEIFRANNIIKQSDKIRENNNIPGFAKSDLGKLANALGEYGNCLKGTQELVAALSVLPFKSLSESVGLEGFNRGHLFITPFGNTQVALKESVGNKDDLMKAIAQSAIDYCDGEAKPYVPRFTPDAPDNGTSRRSPS